MATARPEPPSCICTLVYAFHGSALVLLQRRKQPNLGLWSPPGGHVKVGETPHAAARRELREETGYTSTRWTYLGSVEPNPAFLDNRCHHFLAEDAACTHTPAPDEGEDIAVDTLSAEELRDLILRGEIAHSLVISALCRVMDLRLRS